MIALGDSFHDRDAAERLGRKSARMLAALVRTARLDLDRRQSRSPSAGLAGRRGDGEAGAIGGLVFRHEPRPASQPGEIAGHLHPCATVAKWGRSVRRRCFVSDGLRLVLPSFGAYTGGLDVGEAAIASLFAGPFHAYMLGHARVYAIPRRIAV